MEKINEKIKALFKGKVFKKIIGYVVVALVVFTSGYVVSIKVHNKIKEDKPELVDTRVLKSELR